MLLSKFDSPSYLGRLLSPEDGHFSVHPVSAFRSSQEYFQNTNVLLTQFANPHGGFLTLNYGRQTPVATIISHLIYGAILGFFYR